jgi:5-methylcytosine-specific restriction endonuclease McrA
MIRVTAAAEPPSFNSLVRQPGLDAIAEMVGEIPLQTRPGRKRKKVADRREDIPSESFPPFWRKIQDEMMNSYHRICCYLSLYIECATGAPTIDHVIPKSKCWDLVYEWSNYRLACSYVNAIKNDSEDTIDPFEVEDEWFELELVGFQVKSRQGVSLPNRIKIDRSILILGLNNKPCCDAREEYVNNYWNGEIILSYLERRAPFIARELQRQGRLLPNDL